jgi:anaerobic selenocysteine-containing dehydrogenase
LQREDLFTVVLEQVMTDTALFADILLPATTFLEHHDIRVSYGAYVVGGVQPVIPSSGEAKSNHQVFAALGRAMGWEDEAFTWPDEEAMRRSAGRLRSNDRAVDLRRVEQGEADAYRSEVGAPVQFDTIFPATSDGRIHLAPAVLGDVAYRYLRVGSDRYPLALISPATNRLISSTLGEFNFSELYVELNPEDAAARHVVDGATVRVFNDLGEVVCRARVRDRIRAGVVLMPKGAWRKSSLNGQTATALCPAHVNDVAGGACFNDALVEIEGV